MLFFLLELHKANRFMPAISKSMIPNLSALVFSVLVCQFSMLLHGCNPHEKEALLSFKSSLADPSGRLYTWQGQDCCNWHGIRCSNSSHVVSVDLRNPAPDYLVRAVDSKVVPIFESKSTALSGTLSLSLFNLTHLQYLDLSFNNFQYSKIPLQFAKLKNLVYLNLSNAVFSDNIETQFSNLSSLEIFDLSCSFLIPDYSSTTYNLSSQRLSLRSAVSYLTNGYISSRSLNWLQGLVKLKELVLNGIDLSAMTSEANWAAPIAHLYNLRQLHLSDCGISGPIPVKHFINLTHLSSLHMGFNFLSSPVLTQLENVSTLSSLDFRSSYIEGPIPNFEQLQELYIDDNPCLSVDLTSFFSVPRPNLRTLSIRYNNVSGSIPPSISNASSLVSLTISSTSIEGPIPSSITSLSNLEILELSFNSLTGSLPSSLSSLKNLIVLIATENFLQGPIPESICEIGSLQFIVLERNHFSGSLPDCIVQLTQIQMFYIGDNFMEGNTSLFPLFQNSTPSWIDFGSSGVSVETSHYHYLPGSQLQYLSLRACNLRGKIPDFISKLTQLAVLDLGNNSLTGTIPSWLFQLPKLSSLDLSYNNLQGMPPPSLQMHPSVLFPMLNLAHNNLIGPIPLLPENIDVLDLSWNSFSEEIPTGIGRTLGSARYISFSANNLSGTIPSSLCQPNNSLLMNLDLSKNQLAGRIPSSLGNCRSLISLKLADNYLSGAPPTELAFAENLSSFQVNDNNLNGTFPNFIRQLKLLELLNMGNNQFEGKIPAFIGELLNLRILVLKSNSLYGPIPMELTHLQDLQYVDFSDNQITGLIPQDLGGLKTMTQQLKEGFVLGYMIELVYAGVSLEIVTKGVQLELEYVFSYDTGIDLSRNFLEGDIPSEMGLLQGLAMLNLTRNGLSGEIPMTFGNMRGLESLDLSFNQLTGRVPGTLTSLDFLEYLNLSYNNLSGEIPIGEHFDTLSGDGSAYMGNALLCGPSVQRCEVSNGSNDSKENVDEDDGWNSWELYVCVALGYLLGFYLSFGFLALRRRV